MQTYKKYYLEFIKKIEYILPLLITLIACFGFAITHTSVSIDDTACSRYIDEHYFFSQGRFSGVIIFQILGITRYMPFFAEFIGVVLLTMAVILFCTFFKKISNDKLHPICYTIFSCIFVSYPLFSEAFNYSGMPIGISFGYLLVGISLIITYEGLKNKKIIPFILSSIIMCINVSLYETCAVFYIFGVFAIFILEFLFNEEKSKKLKDIIVNGLKYSIPLAVGIVLEGIISKAIVLSLKTTVKNFAHNQIFWGELPLINQIKYLVKETLKTFIIPALYYLPITILVISIVIGLIMGIVLAVKNKNITVGLLFLGSIFSLFLLTLVSGFVMQYRMCQVFAVFIAFIFMLLWHFTCSLKKSTVTSILKGVVSFLLVVVIVRQANDLNKWFYVENMRYNEDVNNMSHISYEIESKYDTHKKPVVFIGNYEMSENINQYITLDKKSLAGKLTVGIYEKLGIDVPTSIVYTQSNCVNFFGWGNWAFGEVNTETLNYFKYQGHYFNQATPEMKLAAEEYAKKENTPNWPKEGSIFEMDDCIVVNF